MSLAAVALDDKYTLESGRVFLAGTQALVRLPLVQKQRDAAAGLKTGGFISGYRGSPLGTYDMALWQARAFLERGDIRFRPGVNEDLAATAVWGTQQLNLIEKTEYDGVFGITRSPRIRRSDVVPEARIRGPEPLDRRRGPGPVFLAARRVGHRGVAGRVSGPTPADARRRRAGRGRRRGRRPGAGVARGRLPRPQPRPAQPARRST